MSVSIATHLILYCFSVVGFWFTPASLLGRRWIFPLWFFGVNVCLFSGIWKIPLYGSPWLLVALVQVPWVWFTLRFCLAIHRGTVEINLVEWIRWPIFRGMGVLYLFLVNSHELPNEFLLRAAFVEVLCALMAPVVAVFYKRRWFGHWMLLNCWNAFGLFSAWSLNSGILRSFWNQYWDPGAQSITAYWSQFPEAWISSFWIPLSLVVHSVIFFVAIRQVRNKSLIED